MEKLPGIFNDVIGPIMRGPSSSHTAASWRIATTAPEILNEPLKKALIEFDRDGAWAPNYREQGTTMGIEGGLLGLEITDEKIKFTEKLAVENGISFEYRISSFPTNHANTVRLTLWGLNGKEVQIIAVSLGGGSFEIRSFNGFEVQLKGDLYTLLIFAENTDNSTKKIEKILTPEILFNTEQREDIIKYEFNSSKPFSTIFLERLRQIIGEKEPIRVSPVMPIIGGRQVQMPFDSLQSLIKYAEKKDLDLGELGLIYEKCISGATEEELIQKMEHIIFCIHNSITTGLEGTEYDDRILQQQSHLISKAENDGIIKTGIVNQIIAYVTALMESKSAMEVIVAVPTAGSCGTVGGSLRALSEHLDSSLPELIKAYFAAGIVGAYFARGPGFSAEEHGCQVECGAASGMAAAGMVQLLGGTAKQALGATSVAIQNMIGLVCDPVADRVEVPCLGKNISAAVNAYSSAIMSISGYDCVIPLDQVIETVSRVSKTMPSCVKCTGKGGLAITKMAIDIKENLKK